MKKLITLLFCLFVLTAFAQQTEKRCFTMERYNSALYQNQEPIQNLRVPGGSYSNTTGYGAGCTNDCDLSTRMPVPGCNTPSVYQIPIVYRVGTGTGCPQNGNSGPGPIPTQAELDAMLGITNEYFACVGLPVELIKCTSYDTGNLSPGAVVQGDNSTVFEPVDCNFNTAALTDIPNVMNVYVFQDTGNGTGCNGFAYLPGGPDQVAMSTACYNGVTDDYTCGDTGVGVSQVFIHEVGHFLGLFHTHDTDFNSQYGGACDDPSIATDDCSSGDFISDTDEDPDYSGGEICGITNCVTGGPSSNCAFNNAASANCSVYGTPNTIDNIMSYNIFQGCIISLTDCQKAKMIDALTCARTNLVCCDPVITDNADATNYMTESIQYVCAGDAPSAFTVDNPAGAAPALDAGCIAWYDAMGNQLGTGTSFTPPTSGTGAFDNNTPGTYVYFFDDDANEYTTADCDDQVLKQVTVIVLGNAGAGDSGGATTTISDCTAPVVLPIDAVGEALGSDANAIGWYFSTSDPTTTLTTGAAITGAISGAAAGTPTAPADGVIFQSNTNDPETALSALTIDCATLGDGIYYMTPFIAYGQAPVICSQTSPTSAGADYGNPFGGAGILFGAVGPLSCDGMGLPNKTWEVCVDITSAGTNMIVFSVNDPAASCGAIGSPGPTANCPTFPCEFCFQQSDFPAGFDPEVDDYCLAAADGTLSNSQGDIVYTATTTITYTGDDALTIWNADGTPTIQVDNGAESCFWGTPYAVTCDCSACPLVAGEPNTPTATACAAGTGPGANGELDATAIDLSTIFAAPTDPNNEAVINYIAFDAAGNFVAASPSPTFDLSAAGCMGELCVKQMVYTQTTLDAITGAVDGVLTPLGFDPLTPTDLSSFLTFLNGLFGPYDEAGLNDLLTNGLTADFFGIPINIPFPEFCYDFSTDAYCVTVVNCAAACDFSACNDIELIVCGLSWDISAEGQYALGLEGTNPFTEIEFTIGGMAYSSYDGFDVGAVNPGITLANLETSCPTTANATVDVEVCFWEDDSFDAAIISTLPPDFSVGEAPNQTYEDVGVQGNDPADGGTPSGNILEILGLEVFSNADDPFGGAEGGTACETLTIMLDVANGTGQIAGTNYTLDYIVKCTSKDCVCPVAIPVADEDTEVCEGMLMMEVINWQNAITAANPLDATQDPCMFGNIIYSSVDAAAATFPDGTLPDGTHPGGNCTFIEQNAYAYLECDLDGVADSGDETYQLISQYTLTVFPLPDVVNPAGGTCTATVTNNCTAEVSVLYDDGMGGAVTNPAPPTLNSGDPDVTVMWTATNNTTPPGCEVTGSFMLSCSDACPTVTTVADDDGTVCTGGGTDDFATWQGDVAAANTMGLVYSSVTPVGGATAPDGTLPTGNHSASPSCASEPQTVMAYVYCDVDASGGDNAGDTYSLVSTYTLTVFPLPDVTNTAGGACTDMVTDNCGGSTILYSIDNFVTVGTTAPPTLNPGDADVTVNWTASLTGAPVDCEATGTYTLTCPNSVAPTITISDPCSCDAGIAACAAPNYPYGVGNVPGNIDVDADGFILGNGVDLVADVIEIVVNPVIPGETISVTAQGNALSCDGTLIAVGTPLVETALGSGIFQLVVYYPGDGSGFGTMSFEGDMGTASISIANPSAQYEACICDPCRPTCADAGQFPRN